MGSRYSDKNSGGPDQYGQHPYDDRNSGRKNGRRKKRKRTFGDIISTLLMLIALSVFCFSAYTLYGYYTEYKKSADEYDNLENMYMIDFSDKENGKDENDSSGTADVSAESGEGGSQDPVSAEKTVLDEISSLQNIESLEDDQKLEELLGEMEKQMAEEEGASEDGDLEGTAQQNENPGDETQTDDMQKETDHTAAVIKKVEKQIAEKSSETEAAEQAVQKKWVPRLRNPIDFEALSEVNEDIKGWLKVTALDISYPVVQGEDNDYYLHRTFEGVENFAGCIFMNCDNEDDFTDQNTIVYGHNMKDGSMFGKLKKFGEKEVFEKSKYFWMFTPDKIYQYRIFSAGIVNKTGLTYQVVFEDDEFDRWVNAAFSNSVVENSNVTFMRDDRVMTLSTCTGNDATRFVVLGKLAMVYEAM